MGETDKQTVYIPKNVPKIYLNGKQYNTILIYQIQILEITILILKINQIKHKSRNRCCFHVYICLSVCSFFFFVILSGLL